MGNDRITDLVIPVKVEALYLTEEQASRQKVVNATADFSKIPYRDYEGNYQRIGPNISEMLVRKPFEYSTHLESGIHLHWTLPVLLTHGVVSEEPGEGITFPATPNRWLIGRKTRDASLRKYWLAESDHLSSQSENGKVTVPVAERQEDGKLSKMPPFRYLGRVRELTGSMAADDDRHERYKLTAVGYGDPAFAALYPNCKGIFGFHDALDDVPDPEGGIMGYSVTGWYDMQTPGHILALVADWQDGHNSIGHYKVILPEMRNGVGEEEDQENKAREYKDICLDQQWYHGAVILTENKSNNLKISDIHKSVTVGVGNTAGEALSALQSNQDPANENVLNQLYGDMLDALDEQDGSLMASQKLHQDGFASIPGGTLWKIEAEQAENAKNISPEPLKLPGELIDRLNVLNDKQQEVDKLEIEIRQLRFQLYSDWYKYLLARYLPGSAPSDLDLDKVVAFIHQQIAYITKRQKEYNKEKQEVGKLLKETIRSKVNQKPIQGRKWKLIKKAAPRFWQTQDPVIAVKVNTESIQPYSNSSSPLSSRAWRLPMKYKTGLEKHRIKLPDLLMKGFTDQQRTVLLQLLTYFNESPPGELEGFKKSFYNDWAGNAFIPLMLDWKMQYHTLPRDGVAYAETYFTDNYELRPGHEDVVSKSNFSDTFSQYYSGSIILTRSAQKLRMEALKKHNLRESDSSNILSQALNGFNESLLMLKQILQVEVWDTMTSNDVSDTFSNALVREAVAGFNDASPLPLNHYSPIRAGSLALPGLRLIDRFGRVADLEVSKVRWSAGILAQEKSTWLKNQGNTAKTQPKLSPKAVIRPRITQPSRLLFRWHYPNIKAETRLRPLTKSPILGWVIPNFLEGSLVIFGPEGTYRGTIRPKEDGSGLIPDPLLPADHDLPPCPILDKWVSRLEQRDGRYLADLLNVIDQSLININPLQRNQYQHMASLVGRPLALTRAYLALDLYGWPAPDQSWEAFLSSVNSKEKNNRLVKRHNASFTKVEFPVRLGEVSCQRDGLVGYFKENKEGVSDFDTFYYQGRLSRAEQARMQGKTGSTQNFMETTGDHLAFSVEKSITLTLLVDPVGSITATTGILPAKAIDIPPEYYKSALEKMVVHFMMNPLLVVPEMQELANQTQEQETEALDGSSESEDEREDTFFMPLPGHDIASERWKWITPVKDNKRSEKSKKSKVEDSFPYESVLPSKIEFVEGWLQLSMLERDDQGQQKNH